MELKRTPNMARSASVMSRRSIDLKWVHIQVQREIRYNSMAFSTKDRDNDRHGSRNCAVRFTGAWWYNSCYDSNINRQYLGDKSDDRGAVWYHFRSLLSLKFTEMKLRPRS